MTDEEPRITIVPNAPAEAPAAQSGKNLSPAEIAQLHQTIEMFEVITQSQPDDYESLSLLKEAHQRLGNKDEIIKVGRQLADAYVRAGQIPSAIREYEEILQRQPDASGVSEILEELVSKVRSGSKEGRIKAATSDGTVIDIPWGDMPELGAHLIPTSQTKVGAGQERRRVLKGDDGLDALARFLGNQSLPLKGKIQEAVQTVRKINKSLDGRSIATSLLDVLAQDVSEEQMDNLISALLDQTHYPFAPLEYYDVDRQIVRMLPDDLTLARLIVPFDMVSRTLMVAVSNPFDAAVKQAVHDSVDHEVLWYFARPAAISRVLADAYRLTSRD